MKQHPGLLVLAFMISSFSGYAQVESLRLSSQSSLKDDSSRIFRPRKVKFDFQFDNRNSFIQNRAVNIQGLNFGANLPSGIRWGIGAYKIVKPFQAYRSVDQQQITTNRELDMYFITPNFQYSFVDRKWIQTSVVLELGFGSIIYKVYNSDFSALLRQKKGFFMPGGIGLDLLIIPVCWAALEGFVGYRKSLRSYEINKDFDGMFYSYGIKVFLGQILKDVRYCHAKKKRKKSKTTTP